MEFDRNESMKNITKHQLDVKRAKENIVPPKQMKKIIRNVLNDLSRIQNSADYKAEMISQLKGWQEVFYTYRDQYGWKKLFQMIPILGIVFGAFANKGMIEDVSEVGMMLYRKRRVYEKIQKYNETV